MKLTYVLAVTKPGEKAQVIKIGHVLTPTIIRRIKELTKEHPNCGVVLFVSTSGKELSIDDEFTEALAA